MAAHLQQAAAGLQPDVLGNSRGVVSRAQLQEDAAGPADDGPGIRWRGVFTAQRQNCHGVVQLHRHGFPAAGGYAVHHGIAVHSDPLWRAP